MAQLDVTGGRLTDDVQPVLFEAITIADVTYLPKDSSVLGSFACMCRERMLMGIYGRGLTNIGYRLLFVFPNFPLYINGV